MFDHAFARAAFLMLITTGLAACCTQPIRAPHHPAAFGPGGPPLPWGPVDVPHPLHGWHPVPPPAPGLEFQFEDALEACAVELDLPSPSAGEEDAATPLTDDQWALLDLCLEELGEGARLEASEHEEDPA